MTDRKTLDDTIRFGTGPVAFPLTDQGQTNDVDTQTLHTWARDYRARVMQTALRYVLQGLKKRTCTLIDSAMSQVHGTARIAD